MSEAPLDRRLMAALALACTLAPLGSTSLAVALPSMARDLGVSVAVVTQWLVTSYLVVGIVCQSPGGKLGDLIGHRRALGLGQAMVALGTLCGLLAPHLAVLVVARVLMAAGGAAVLPSAMAMARNSLAPDRQARAFAAFGAMMGLSAAIGPTMGGELTARFGWRAVFVPNLAILALSVLLARAPTARAAAGARRPAFDLLGTLLLAVALVASIAVMKSGRLAALPVALAALAAFVAWERRVASPVIDLSLFSRRAFTCGGLVVALGNMAMYAFLFELPGFFARARAQGAGATGRALLGMMLGMVVCSPLGARLSERVGPRLAAALGLSLCGVGVHLLGDGARLRVPSDALPALVLMGVGLGLSSSPAQAASIAGVPREQAGMAAGVTATLRYLGGIAGIAVLGALGNGATPEALLAQHHRAGVIFTGVLALAVALSMGLPGRVEHASRAV